MITQKKCWKCGGTGQTVSLFFITSTCNICDGKGLITLPPNAPSSPHNIPMINPYNQGVSWYFQVEDMMRHKDYALAIKWCEKSIAEFPKNTLAWWYLGMAYHDLTRWTEAIDCYLEAINRGRTEAEKSLKDLAGSAPMNVMREYQQQYPDFFEVLTRIGFFRKEGTLYVLNNK